MSAKIMGQVFDLDLPANKMLVLLAMADHADHDGAHIFPALARIAWKTGYSESQVRRIVKALVKDGLLIEVKVSKGRHPTEYKVNLSAGTKKPPYQGDRVEPAQDARVDYTQPLQNGRVEPAQIDRVEETEPLHSYDRVNPSTAMTPKPSIEPSEKTNTYKNARTEKKRPSKQQQFLVEWNEHKTSGEALLTAFGHDLKFRGVAEMSVASCQPYLEAAIDLDESAFPTEDIPALYTFVDGKAKKENWSGFSVKTLPKYAEDYLRSKIQLVKPRERKLTQAELDAIMPSASNYVKFRTS